jgi:hypothetical protein
LGDGSWRWMVVRSERRRDARLLGTCQAGPPPSPKASKLPASSNPSFNRQPQTIHTPHSTPRHFFRLPQCLSSDPRLSPTTTTTTTTPTLLSLPAIHPTNNHLALFSLVVLWLIDLAHHPAAALHRLPFWFVAGNLSEYRQCLFYFQSFNSQVSSC